MLSIILFSLAGCKLFRPEDSANVPAPQRTRVRVMWMGYPAEDHIDEATGREREGYLSMTQRLFTSQGHSDIEIEFIEASAEDAGAALREGQADILLADGVQVPVYAQQGLLRPIDDLVAAEADFIPRKSYLPGLYDSLRNMNYSKTEHFGLPFTAREHIIVQDSVLFAQWGEKLLLQMPSPEQVLEKAKAMTGINPVTGVQNYGLFFDPAEEGAATLISLLSYYQAQGGRGSMAQPGEIEWAIDTPAFRSALAWVDEAVKYAPPGIVDNQGGGAKAQSGNQVGMYLNTNGTAEMNLFYGTREGTWITRDRPVMNMGKNGAAWVNLDTFVMAKDVQNVDAAWEVMKFLSGYDMQKWAYEQYGATPTLADADFILKVDDYTSTARKILEVSPISPLMDISNPFFAEQIVPFFKDYVADRAAGVARDVDKDLAALQTKAEEWSAGFKK